VSAAAGLVAIAPVADGDIYWHLAAGRLMRATHALLREDPFTVSAAGRPWLDVHWLFQLGASALHDAAGFSGLALAAAALLAGACCLGLRTAERSGGDDARDLTAVLTLGGLFAARHLVALRPVLLTLVFMALYLAYLERWRSDTETASVVGGVASAGLRRRQGRWLALAALQVVWTNCQGLSYLGPGLIAAYLLGEIITRRTTAKRSSDREGVAGGNPARPPLRELGVVLGACAVGSLITPYGIGAWLLPFSLLGRLAPTSTNVFSLAVAENVPPFLLARTTGNDPAHLFLALGVLTLGVLALWALGRRPRLGWGPGFVLVGLVALALMANRNILLLYVIAPALLGPLFARAGKAQQESTKARLAYRLLIGTSGAFFLAGSALAQARETAAGKPTPFRFPVGAARLLAEAHAEGTVFAPDHQSGYLAFEVPGLRPYIDTRLVLHSGAEYADYLSLLDDPDRFDALDARAHFRFVVLTAGLPGRYLSLAAHLVADPTWHLLYTDGTELLFARAGDSWALASESTLGRITAELDRTYGDHASLREVAYLNLSRLLVACGQADAARDVLASFTSRAAAWLRARALFAGSDWTAAEAVARLLLDQEARDADGQALAATVLLAEGNEAEGRAALARALSLDPFNPEARQLAARLGTPGATP
jgi:hypothetical protein